MKFFLDTANLKQIQEVQNLGILDGVTTNPSLIAREGIKGDVNIKQHYIEICNIVREMLARKLLQLILKE